MKKLFALLLGSFLLTGIITLQSCQSTKTSTASKMLKFNFEKGRGFDYEMTTNIDMEAEGRPVEMDMSMYYSMNVTDDNGTEKIISSTFDRLKMNMDLGIMKLDVDTDKPLETSGEQNEIEKAMGMFNKVFGSIKGKKFQMKVNAEGKVTEVTGFKEMGEDIVNSIGEELGPEEKEKMKQQFAQQFNDEDMKGQFERILYIFPNKEVKLGDTWQKNTSSKQNGMPMNFNSTYKVTEIEGDMVTLEEKSILKSSQGEMNLDGKTEGEIIVDSRTGLIVSSTQNMDMKMSMAGKSQELKSVTRIKGKAN